MIRHTRYNKRLNMRQFLFILILSSFSTCTWCFVTTTNLVASRRPHQKKFPSSKSSHLCLAQVSQQEAQKGIDQVVQALRKDSSANQDIGRLQKVTVVLGFGMPNPSSGILNVRFNAEFKKGGMGRSAIPLPFGLGQTNESEGRGSMVGQVKASVNTNTGKVTSCSVFRDLGYGRAFNLKV